MYHLPDRSHRCCLFAIYKRAFHGFADEKVKVCIIGLGGGGLAMFLHQHFRKVKL